MRQLLHFFSKFVISIGVLFVLAGLYGFTQRGQAHLRGRNFGVAVRIAEEHGDNAAAQTSAFQDDDTAMGAGLVPFLAVGGGIALVILGWRGMIYVEGRSLSTRGPL